MVVNNKWENAKRIDHQYKEGDLVKKIRPGIQRKLRRKKDGPFTVTKVYTNGNIRIRCRAITERINIRRVGPYYEAESDE